MRPFLALTLVAAPLAAQGPTIGPAPSVLFATPPMAVAQDTVRVDDGMPQGQGAFLGMLGGAGLGYLLGSVMDGSPTCATLAVDGGCGRQDPVANRVKSAVFGGMVGLFVGSALAGPHAPRVPSVPLTRSDSLAVARRKGGKVGAVVGGLLVGGAGLVIAKQNQRDPTCTSSPSGCSASGGQVDVVPVVLATGAGTLAGYLLGRSIPTHRPNPRPHLETEHPVVWDTGIKWWQGAMIGGILGGVGAPMAVKSLRLDEQGDGVPAVLFAPVGALLGLVIGGSLAQSR